MILEVCVDSVDSAVNAKIGGAHRIELCSELSVGGLTPTTGLVREVKKRVELPVFVMLRPRSGSFVYASSEMEVVMEDMKILKEERVDGFVFGALTTESKVDTEACKKIVSCAKPSPVTFHRAFDLVSDNWKPALQEIKDLGFDRVLTSGQAPTAMMGKEKIRQIVQESRRCKIAVIVGSGVNEGNLKELIEETQALEFHSSASVKKPAAAAEPSHIRMGTAEPLEQKVASVAKIHAMNDILKCCVLQEI